MRFLVLVFICISFTANLAYAGDSCIYVRNESKSAAVYMRKLNAFARGSFPYVLSPGETETIKLYTDQPVFAQFQVLGNARIYLVVPGDSIAVTGETGIPVITMNNAEKNKQAEFMNALYTNVVEMNELKLKVLSKSETLAARDAYLLSIHNKAMNFLDNNLYQYTKDEWFAEKCRKLILYKTIANKFKAQIHNYKYVKGLKQYYQKEFRKYVDSFDTDIKYNLFEAKMAALAVNSVLADSDDPVIQYQQIDSVFKNPGTRNFLKTKIVYDLLISNNKQYRKIIKDFYATCNDAAAVASIKELEALKTNSVEINSNETVLLDGKGKKLTFSAVLEQCKGNIVYIDFWASWCLPCKREMPYAAKLRDQFAGKKIIFLYISADEDFKAWSGELKNVQLQHHPYSYVFADPYNNFLVKLLKINSYPRYIIFDQQGKLIESDAKRPGDADLQKTLRSLVN